MSPSATLVRRQDRSIIMGTLPVEKSIRCGVVGLGNRSVHNVLPKLIRYDEFTVAAVCDVRKEVTDKVVAELREKHDLAVPGYLDFDQMLQSESLDAVVLQLDPDRQIPLACRAMNAGLHVMAEVPLTYSLDDCWNLVATVERTGKVFLLMEQLRYAGYVAAWREIIRKDVIGHPLFVEGQYFHYLPWMHFQDDSGRFFTRQQVAEFASNAKPTWRFRQPSIGYLPHELSPLLYILDDRVVRVEGMSTRKESYKHPGLEYADMQVALMHTEKDTIMRLATSFSAPYTESTSCHWHHIKGSEGFIETPRAACDKAKLWVHGWHLDEPLTVPWSYKRTDAPPEAHNSGHGDLDFYVFAQFADAVLYGAKPTLDVYKAVETAAPAILAARSMEQDNAPQNVPDFRPGPHRPSGQLPKNMQ
ncbi:MAG: Gfo/Idh/MocA family oxidoreductase [Phycisphaerae bacterium]|nr:Gfo/Idh/MocA family oxidoreductase [Phycisphaerae bacterium]